ncbi:type II/IV secretion system protein, partial [Pseudomonas aeruginosa]
RAQPFVQRWDRNVVHVLKRPIKRVVAKPADIQRYTVEYFRLARSVSGATSPDQMNSGVGNFEQLLNHAAADHEPDAN